MTYFYALLLTPILMAICALILSLLEEFVDLIIGLFIFGGWFFVAYTIVDKWIIE